MHFILTLIQQFKLNNTFSKSIDTNMKFKIVFLKEKKLIAVVTKVIFLLGTSTSIHQSTFLATNPIVMLSNHQSHCFAKRSKKLWRD